MALALILVVTVAAQTAPAPPPTPPPAPIADGFAFCADAGAHPLAVVKVNGPVATVRVAPLTIAIGENAPTVIVPRHVDERWPSRDVKSACLTRAPPALPEKPGVSVAFSSTPQLVFGCRADPVDARIETGALSIADGPASKDNTCLAYVDVRAPCPRRESEDDPAFERRRKEAEAQTKARLARLVPRYPHGGPALLVRAQAARSSDKLFLVERLLESEACGCSEDAANVVSTRVALLRTPALTEPAVLSIAVPRYVGAAYDLVTAVDEEAVDADAVTRIAYTDAFSALAPEEEHVIRVFSAPEACPCDCED